MPDVAIHFGRSGIRRKKPKWIASSLALLAMTVSLFSVRRHRERLNSRVAIQGTYRWAAPDGILHRRSQGSFQCRPAAPPPGLPRSLTAARNDGQETAAGPPRLPG